jgi:sigma-B regulation protein RsbU (phosphoserine phosphatase)
VVPERRRTTSARAGFLRVLWTAPLWSVLAALFFGTLYGGSWPAYRGVYKISLVFSYGVGLSIWAFENFGLPALRGKPPHSRAMPVWVQAASFVVVAIVASLVSAVIVNATLMPRFLDSARTLLIIAMYALLFSVLGVGLVYAQIFYRESLRRAQDERELETARGIQRSFLPSSFPVRATVEMHAVNVPSRQVSGDFYDIVPDGDHAFLIAIADVSGKGMPAALLSSMLQAALRTHAGDRHAVGAILGRINRVVVERSPSSQFATFFLARLDEETLTLTSSNAGHNAPLLFRDGQPAIPLERGGTVVGFLQGAEFGEETHALRPGDRVLLYTDGISEAPNAAREMFGEERLAALVASLPSSLSAGEINARILESVRAFTGDGEPADDMTLLALRILAPAAAAAADRSPEMVARADG